MSPRNTESRINQPPPVLFRTVNGLLASTSVMLPEAAVFPAKPAWMATPTDPVLRTSRWRRSAPPTLFTVMVVAPLRVMTGRASPSTPWMFRSSPTRTSPPAPVASV